MKRVATFVISIAILAGGVFGAWAYGHNYYEYRGFSPPRNPPGVTPGREVTGHLYSAALGRRRSYKVWLPPGYAAAAAAGVRFPVLYLLHGSPGRPDLFVNVGAVGVAVDTLVARHAMGPFIVAMPDGRDHTFRSDTEWANTPDGRYEGLVLDVVHAVDRTFATKADRAHRGIAGNSEGAYGAVNIALRHLGTFGLTEAWSGYFTQRPVGPFKAATPAQLRANSPLLYVSALRAQLRRQPFYAFLYGGRRDPETKRLRGFGPRLTAAGGHVVAKVYPGRHTWRLWRTEMPASLLFAAAHLGAA
jgi:enterochelin esterase-like enzyme